MHILISANTVDVQSCTIKEQGFIFFALKLKFN